MITSKRAGTLSFHPDKFFSWFRFLGEQLLAITLELIWKHTTLVDPPFGNRQIRQYKVMVTQSCVIWELRSNLAGITLHKEMTSSRGENFGEQIAIQTC